MDLWFSLLKDAQKPLSEVQNVIHTFRHKWILNTLKKLNVRSKSRIRRIFGSIMLLQDSIAHHTKEIGVLKHQEMAVKNSPVIRANFAGNIIAARRDFSGSALKSFLKQIKLCVHFIRCTGSNPHLLAIRIQDDSFGDGDP